MLYKAVYEVEEELCEDEQLSPLVIMQPSKSPDPTYDGPAHTVSRTFNTSPWRKRLLRE